MEASSALQGTLWHDTEITRPHAIVEVIAADQLTVRVHVRTGPDSGVQLQVPITHLGRRFIPVLHRHHR